MEFELHPQYIIEGDNDSKSIVIGFAFFYPRTDGNGKIKIAIECDTHLNQESREQISQERQIDRYLQSKGWLVARFTGDEIQKKDVYDLIHEIEKIAMTKDHELFNESHTNNINWRLN